MEIKPFPLLNRTGNQVYPETKDVCVEMSNGIKLDEFANKISTNVAEIGTKYNDLVKEMRKVQASVNQPSFYDIQPFSAMSRTATMSTAEGSTPNTWYDGVGFPSNDFGNESDYYLQLDDTFAGDIYKKINDSWERVGNIKGNAGEVGAKGDQGVQGIQGIQGQKGDTGAQGLPGIQGPKGLDGASGSIWHDGVGSPKQATGNVDDYYLDIQTGDIYSKKTSHWERIGSLVKYMAALEIDHTHSNKASLDSITSTKLLNWNDAYTHSISEHVSRQYVDDSVSSVDTELKRITEIVEPFTITLNSSSTVAEKGSTVSSINFTWSYNKNISSQKFENVSIAVADRSNTYTTPISVNKTFTLESISETGITKTKTSTLSFYNGVYYGKSQSGTYDNALISSLAKVLSDSKGRTITVNALSGEYIYYCLPSRLGIPVFVIGGFEGGFSKVSTISFTNQSGFSESYDIYKSTNANLGSTTIVIS